MGLLYSTLLLAAAVTLLTSWPLQVEGYMYCNSQNRMRMRIYNCFNDVKLHHHFAPIVTRPLDTPDRKPRIDWSRFHLTDMDPADKAQAAKVPLPQVSSFSESFAPMWPLCFHLTDMDPVDKARPTRCSICILDMSRTALCMHTAVLLPPYQHGPRGQGPGRQGA